MSEIGSEYHKVASFEILEGYILAQKDAKNQEGKVEGGEAQAFFLMINTAQLLLQVN